MNINYNDIITKANERKDALKKYEAAVLNLDYVLSAEAITYQHALQRLKEAHEGLDAEAHKVLPECSGHPAAYVLSQWVCNVLSQQGYFILPSNSGITPQAALNKLLES